MSGLSDSFGLASGHVVSSETSNAAGISGCASCHDVHGSADGNRNIPARRVNGVAVFSAGRQLCVACHDDADSWYGAGYPSTTSPTRDATGYPVSGTWPGPSTYDSDTDAHRLIPAVSRTSPSGESIDREQGDCRYCHASHGGANAYDGLLTTFTVPSQSTLSADRAEGSYAALCFTCHGDGNPNALPDAPVNIKRFVTAASDSAGHSIVTSGGTLPVGAQLPCFECHNPHGSKRGNSSLLSDERGSSLGTTNAARVREFCFTCHTTSDTTAGWDSSGSTYAPVDPAEKIVGLPREGGVLHLPAVDGHAEGDSASCYECHGNSYDLAGNNVHNPSVGAAATSTAAAPLAPAPVFGAGTLLVRVFGPASTDASASSEASAPLTMASSADATSASAASTATDASATPLASVSFTDATSASTPTASTDASATAPTAPSITDATPASAASTPPIAVDVTPPMTVSDVAATYVASATVTLSAVDDAGGTGVAQTWFVLDGSDATAGTVASIATAGSHTLKFWSVDNAGNVEVPTTVEFTVIDEQTLSMVPAFGVGRDYVLGMPAA